MKKTIIAKNLIITSITTLWGRISSLLPVLIIPLTIACEDPGEIGLELNPENGAFVAKYQELSLNTSMVLVEDILSDNSTRISGITQNPSTGGRVLFGNYSTPEFGTISTKGFASLYIDKYGFKPNEKEFVYDSLVLFMFVDYLYGESFQGTKQINIHELKEEIKVDSVYLTKNSTPYLDEPVGTLNFDISSLDSVRVDTLLRVRLSDVLGNRLFDRAYTDTVSFSNNVEFRKFFNGFAFVPGATNDMITGIVMENQSTFVRMYIHNATDTTKFDFIFAGYDTAGLNITRYYNNIILDRTGSSLEQRNDYYTDFYPLDDRGLAQSSTGVFTKLDFTPYLNFIDTVDNLIINRAELLIPAEPYDTYFDPISSLELVKVDEFNRFVEQMDSSRMKIKYLTAGKLSFKKDKNDRSGKYEGLITDYIQSITTETKSNRSIYTSVLLGQADLWNSVISTNQSIIPLQEIRLRVYYSTLK